MPQSLSPCCPQCGSKDLTRLFSSFTVGKGEWYKRKGVYDDILSDSRLIGGMTAGDTRALAEWNRRMSQTMEEEPAPEHEEMLARMEAGEPLEQVMKSVKQEEEE
jgi:hypothetical protein